MKVYTSTVYIMLSLWRCICPVHNRLIMKIYTCIYTNMYTVCIMPWLFILEQWFRTWGGWKHVNILFLLSHAEGPGREILQRPRPSICLSIRLSVTFGFRTVTRKHIAVFSQNFAGVCTMSWACAVYFFCLISCFLYFLCYFQHF